MGGGCTGKLLHITRETLLPVPKVWDGDGGPFVLQLTGRTPPFSAARSVGTGSTKTAATQLQAQHNQHDSRGTRRAAQPRYPSKSTLQRRERLISKHKYHCARRDVTTPPMKNSSHPTHEGGRVHNRCVTRSGYCVARHVMTS